MEEVLKKKVLDRAMLILDIFANRARTVQAKTQVELAQLQYMLPRLKGMWSHLERQRGGAGTRGGAGEKEIETDRRIASKKITFLKEKLKDVYKRQPLQRSKSITRIGAPAKIPVAYLLPSSENFPVATSYPIGKTGPIFCMYGPSILSGVIKNFKKVLLLDPPITSQ